MTFQCCLLCQSSISPKSKYECKTSINTIVSLTQIHLRDVAWGEWGFRLNNLGHALGVEWKMLWLSLTVFKAHFNPQWLPFQYFFQYFFHTAMFLCFGYNIVIIGSLMAFVTNDVSSRKSCLRKQWRAPLYIKRWPAALILPLNPPVRVCNEWREGDTYLHQNLDLLYI